MTTQNPTRPQLNFPPSSTSLPKVGNLQRRQKLWGLLFLSPWILGFLAFTLFPMLASLFFSFTDYNLGSTDPINIVGLRNYAQIGSDPLVATSLTATLKFALIALPLSIVLPVALAALLNSKYLVGKPIIRTLFYMPYMVPVVSSVAIWGGMLNSESGWINRIFALFGMVGPEWLNDVNWIYPAMNIIGLWGIGNAFLITLASMQGVPTELYEAARVDGANGWSRFRSITLPMISPVIFYNLVLSVIGLLRYFEIPYILSQGTGRPGGATMFFNIHLYKTAFVFNDMGYGSALAWMLFGIAFAATLLLFFSARFWVYYASGDAF
jgi:multiple sugar transport system permease protein